MYVGATHTPLEESIEASSEDKLLDQSTGQPQIALWHSDEQVQGIAAAMVLRNQLTEKARQVLSYLNNSRALDQPSYTVPIGYAQISREADLSEHYLRREVLPKLAMLGLIAVAHKSFQGTTYHLHHNVQFLRLIASKDSDFGIPTRPAHPPSQQALPLSGGETVLPSWIDREHWGWLPAESVQLLVAKAGTESQAKEKLDIIIYNESHGPEDRRVRDRRAVLSHYLRTPQADIWPNDNGYESRSLRLAREERDRALQEKALTEEALHIRQEAAKARFLANLEDAQLVWLKQEAKRRVDARPESRMLSSRYPLYKAEEEEVILEWMDRVSYGEEIPTAGERTAE
jgi:hypothetical protein